MNMDVMGVQEVSPGYELVAENPAVPVGYKHSASGLIPEEWETLELEQALTLQRGYDLPHRLRKVGNVPIISSSGVSGSHVVGKVAPPGVVTGRYGTIGEVFYVSQEYWPLNTTLYVKDFKENDPRFIYYLLKTVDFVSHSGKSGVPGVNRNDVHKEQIALPPVHEQRAIATALIDVDALLEELDRLIAKKRDIKQAAMQQLLTGETRLPGFEGEWEQVELGEVTDRCTSGATPYRGRPDFYKGNIRWISSGELNYGVINDTNEHISLEAVRSANLTIHPAGIFLMAITGLEAAGTRGACGIVGKPSATNQSCMAIYPTKKLDTMYLFHYYVFRGDALAFKYCQGTKQQSYTAGLVKKLPISLPPSVEEQRAIAAVLSDMDTEIQALEQRRSKTAELKQGMMQELLTGRTRLV